MSRNQPSAHTYHLRYSRKSDSDYGSFWASNDLTKTPTQDTTTPRRCLFCQCQLWAVFLSSVVACLPVLLGGCALSFSSSALLDLDDLEQRPAYKFNLLLSDIFGTLAPIGALFGGLIAGWIADQAGRKTSLMMVGAPNLVGLLFMTYAHFVTDPVAFKVVLLTGRFFTGVGLGWACVSTPIYLAEISSRRTRGGFTSFTEVFISLGTLCVYLLGSFESFPYHYSALVQMGILAIFELLMIFLYETPRWLLAHDKKGEAIKALKFFRGMSFDNTTEIKEIEDDIAQYPRLKISQIIFELGRRKVMIPLLIICTVFFFQEIGGINASFAYSAQIFQEAQVENYRSTSTSAVGGVLVVFSVIGALIVDCIGRKLLLIISGTGMLIGTATLGTFFYVTQESCANANTTSNALSDDINICNRYLSPLAIVSLILFNATFAIGWGPVPWVLLGELIPLRVRGVGSGIATLVTWVAAALVTGFYLEFAKAVNIWGAWWTFSTLNALSIAFVILFVYETKGKSLEDIQNKFDSRRS